jgi:hypothetical protein
MSANAADGGSGMKPWSGESNQTFAPAKPASRRPLVYMAVVVVVLIVVVAGFVAAFVLPRLHHPASSPPGTVLIPSGTSYGVFIGQSAGDSFDLNDTETVSGAFTTTYGVQAFVLTTVDYDHYARYGNVTSYDWTSGQVTSGSFNVQLGPGNWEVAFIDFKPQATDVLITSNVVLST